MIYRLKKISTQFVSYIRKVKALNAHVYRRLVDRGIILSDIGLEPFVDRLQGLLQVLGERLFPGPGCAWDGHHCFIVRPLGGY